MLNIIVGTAAVIGGAIIGRVTAAAVTANWIETPYEVYDTSGGVYRVESDPIPFGKDGFPKADDLLWTPFWAYHGADKSIKFVDPQGRQTEVFGPRHPRYLKDRTVSSTRMSESHQKVI